MMARISYVEPLLRVYSQTLRAIELAVRGAAASKDANQFLSFCCELLHAFGQTVFAHENVTVRIHDDRTWKRQLARVRDMCAPLRDQFAVRREVVDPRIMRLEHDDVSLPV